MIQNLIARLRPLLLLAIAGAASGANAQLAETAPPSRDATSGCELHVWPSPGLESATEGWIRNNTQNQTLRDPPGKSLGLANAIAPQAQLDAIASLNLVEAFHLNDAKVITHADPLPPLLAGAPIVRQSSATTPCYAELIIKRLVYARNPLSGGALQSFFVFRQFGPTDVRSFTSMADTPVLSFPWKVPEEAERGRAELANALRTDLLTFAKYSNKPPAKRR